MRLYHASMVLILTAGALAGGFGNQQAATPDPNLFPTNYRTALLAFLRQSLTNRSDFRGVMISEPAIKTVGGSQHYVVCVQFSPQSAIKTKAASSSSMLAYQPFKELEAANPTAGESGHFLLLGPPL